MVMDEMFETGDDVGPVQNDNDDSDDMMNMEHSFGTRHAKTKFVSPILDCQRKELARVQVVPIASAVHQNT